MLYLAIHARRQILVWSVRTATVERNHVANLYEFTNLFVTMNGDIFYENGNESGRIEKWTVNSSSSVFVANFSGHCYSLFIDMRDTLYCSLHDQHKIVWISIDENNITNTSQVGTGSFGNDRNQLAGPWGIFVDTNFDLYVADSKNNRIQCFQQGELNGTTKAGNGIPTGLILNFPTDVVLDADGFLYIADNKHYRIIRSGPDHFQCVAGCTNKSGSLLNELYKPYAIRFDSHGNLYVADEYNNRTQKFSLSQNSCGKFYSI